MKPVGAVGPVLGPVERCARCLTLLSRVDLWTDLPTNARTMAILFHVFYFQSYFVVALLTGCLSFGIYN